MDLKTNLMHTSISSEYKKQKKSSAGSPYGLYFFLLLEVRNQNVFIIKAKFGLAIPLLHLTFEKLRIVIE